MDQDWLSVQRIREGDRSAFDEIFTRHKALVINLAFRFTRSREAAEDIAQDIFIKIYEGRNRPEPRAKFTTWLYRVTVNAAIDFTRRKKFTPFSLDEDVQRKENIPHPESLSPRQALHEKEIQTLIQREIDRLSETLRSVILLYQFEELSYQEIAQVLGISEKAVERRLYHAKEALRKKLKGDFSP